MDEAGGVTGDEETTSVASGTVDSGIGTASNFSSPRSSISSFSTSASMSMETDNEDARSTISSASTATLVSDAGFRDDGSYSSRSSARMGTATKSNVGVRTTTATRVQNPQRVATSTAQTDTKTNIFVRSIEGKTTKLNVKLAATVEEVKYEIQRTLTIPYESQRLVYNGRNLDRGTLQEHNVANRKKISSLSGMTVRETKESDSFSKMEILGQGGFGIVYLYKHKVHGRVALKKIEVSNAEDEETFQNERRIHEGLNHPNIVKFVGDHNVSTTRGLFLEYLENGNVIDFMERFIVPWQWKTQIAHDVSLAMWYLHDQQPSIIHGDLKPKNF